MNVDLVLLAAAFVCFVLAALNVNSPRVSFVPLGLALWVLSAIL